MKASSPDQWKMAGASRQACGPAQCRRWADRSWRKLIAIGLLSTMPHPGFGAAHCLDYGSVSLSGTLVRQTYAGPPDYESVTRGDEPQVIWVLQLDWPICVADSSLRYASAYGEREIQLVLQTAQYDQYRNLLMKKVVVSGQLLPGGARHHKRLLIAASEIERTRLRPVGERWQ
jgi:hypothetical protein